MQSTTLAPGYIININNSTHHHLRNTNIYLETNAGKPTTGILNVLHEENCRSKSQRQNQE